MPAHQCVRQDNRKRNRGTRHCNCRCHRNYYLREREYCWYWFIMKYAPNPPPEAREELVLARMRLTTEDRSRLDALAEAFMPIEVSS
jgi:hypothetical protein